ncbi:aminotransferase class III-fold pyridoxal phosphate-dependent enzyme [Sphingomonas jatrophae]|uniref:Glutamate-1-semialdehyde 2,1-aminomutase n=1 Tax=Sphingomonas jatrophae TaxID=1166337 RepID=A0A1I6JEA7_9SPHN|nr:aminotransferase class III-fold pyridoxal phosphate-dependent enzyme [Sphingomonas jatrophae]SFR77363.1 glutamate-1-semialdehyde 2,1-aminomutase [Sphingomonas jatrophae]
MLPLLAGIAAAGAATLLARAPARLRLSRAKHASLAGHPRMAKRVAGLLPYYDLSGDVFFRADGAPDDVVARRRAGFERLAALYAERFPRSRALTAEARVGLSDLQFTASYRVPFPFSRTVREHLGVGAFLERSEGNRLIDLDGNAFWDLTGSYGVNLFGQETYKACVAEAVELAGPLGGVLGQYHPVVAANIARLKAISGLDEVSFHMSGTEAVMQAVRLARYHTGRPRLVRFAGAYHGWWGDVQPGPGNPIPADRTLTLAEMSERSLGVLARRKDVACVLVNPLQALHPNAAAPSDGTLVAGRRAKSVARADYAAWLEKLAAVCRANGIVLILDDVFTGFRLAPRGAAEYFGIAPDMVTYGKTLGGGLPVGVLCGRAELMKRYRDDRPADLNFARGTFNANPYVMAAMDAFLRRWEGDEGRALYDGLDARWAGRAAALEARLAEAGAPLGIDALSTIWTMLHRVPSRYNWMLQYYLRAEGVALSWVGTGRFIFSLDYSDADMDAVGDAFVAAARAMQADGWWWTADGASDKRVSRRILGETVKARLGR